MKKIMFITLTILFALSASSCRDKKEQNRTEQQIENAKENVNDALDKASNKIEDGADKVKDAWKETKKDVQQGTEKVKKEIIEITIMMMILIQSSENKEKKFVHYVMTKTLC